VATGKVKTFSFKSTGELGHKNKSLTRPKTPPPISIKTPLRIGADRTGIFEMHVDPREMIRDNLKNLILTNRGERLGRASVGANLQPLCSERLSRETFDAEAMMRIQMAVGKYMPFVELEDYSSTIEAPEGVSTDAISKIKIVIVYNIPKFKIVKETIGVTINSVG
jgi:phage baseplate assembly protein W